MELKIPKGAKEASYTSPIIELHERNFIITAEEAITIAQRAHEIAWCEAYIKTNQIYRPKGFIARWKQNRILKRVKKRLQELKG